MANRHLARSIVLQTLFEYDFYEGNSAEPDKILNRNVKEFAPKNTDISFMKNLLAGVFEKKSKIDVVLEKATPDWSISRIAIADRNILRIGLYELLFENRKDVPAKVAINEAIELAKCFGGENSGRFVNGVMGAVYKEIGEPGKNETSKKQNIDLTKIPTARLGGAVVYARADGDIYLALVHDVFGRWTLSKGRVETEDIVKGTAEKIKEELGLDVKIEEELGKNEYIASDPEKGKIRKQVTYFIAQSLFEDINLKDSGGLDDARWFKLKNVPDLNTYDDILPIIIKAINILLAKQK